MTPPLEELNILVALSPLLPVRSAVDTLFIIKYPNTQTIATIIITPHIIFFFINSPLINIYPATVPSTVPESPDPEPPPEPDSSPPVPES